MTQPLLDTPQTDPTTIFETFRGNHATELLTAAVAHFDLFAKLVGGPLAFDALRAALGLESRPATVLLVALRAMGLLTADAPLGRFDLTPLAREHLLPGGRFYVGDYVGLQSDSPSVLDMVERLRTNRPAGASAKPAGEGDDE